MNTETCITKILLGGCRSQQSANYKSLHLQFIFLGTDKAEFCSNCNAYLRKKVRKNVDVPLEMNVIKEAQYDTKCHL